MANVQIPEELFLELCKYHLLDIKDEQVAIRIANGLEQKYETIKRRTEYTEYLRQKNDHK